VIDLHLHTNASDGRLPPADLVTRASLVGITIMSVTDHDTVAGLPEVHRSAARAGIEVVDGIEITAVHDGRDVHVLGYFIDTSAAPLGEFLVAQRTQRVERARAIAARLSRLGIAVDVDALLAKVATRPGASVGRPMIARAMVGRGHVASVQEAFERYLAAGQPAYVPRSGQQPADVIAVIHRVGGLASLAHPGVTRKPELIEPLIESGLDALEVYHSDHAPEVQRDTLKTARQFGLLVTGGSDFHGDDDRRPLGGVALPPPEFERLRATVRSRHADRC